MAIQNSVSNYFLFTFVDSINVFDWLISRVVKKERSVGAQKFGLFFFLPIKGDFVGRVVSTLFILMGFPRHIHTISMDLSSLYFMGAQVEISKKYFCTRRLFLSKQTVQTLMKCCMMQLLVWVFNVCKCTCFPVSRIKRTVSIRVLLSIWVKVFRIIPEFRILRLTFHRKSASKC